MADERAILEILAETKAALADVKKLERNFRSTTERMDKSADQVDFDKGIKSSQALLGGIGKLKAAFGALAAFVAGSILFDKLKESVTLLDQQEKAVRQVEAALASTGGTVGFTSDQLQALASSLQAVTVFGDETILVAESILLTFTKISGDVFPKTVEAVLDVATRMDGDLKSAALQVGKALNDPIRGLDGLNRAGIQFSDQQKEVIKTLAETGRVAEAQTLILKELETQFGGSARAAAEGLGVFQQLGKAIGDLKEQFASGFSDELVTDARGLLDAVKETEPAARALGQTFGFLFKLLPLGVAGFQALRTSLAGAATVVVSLLEGGVRLVNFMTGGLIPGLRQAVEDLSIWRESLNEVAQEQLQNTVDSLQAFTDGLNASTAAQQAATAAMRDQGQAAQENADTVSDFDQLWNEWMAAEEAATASTEKNEAALKTHTEAAKSDASALDERTVAADRAREAQERYADAVRSGIDSVESLDEQQKSIQGELDELNSQYSLTAEQLERQAELEDELWDVQQQRRDASVALNDATEDLAASMRDQTTASDGLVAALKASGVELDGFLLTASGAEPTLADYQRMVEAATHNMDNFGFEHIEAVEGLRIFQDDIPPVVSGLEDLAKGAEEAAGTDGSSGVGSLSSEIAASRNELSAFSADLATFRAKHGQIVAQDLPSDWEVLAGKIREVDDLLGPD